MLYILFNVLDIIIVYNINNKHKKFEGFIHFFPKNHKINPFLHLKFVLTSKQTLLVIQITLYTYI